MRGALYYNKAVDQVCVCQSSYLLGARFISWSGQDGFRKHEDTVTPSTLNPLPTAEVLQEL